MAVLNRQDFFAKLNERLGSDTSDDGIAFLEDMTDTYNDLERKANGDGIDWEARYRENDENWKKKYQHRFFSGGGDCNSFPDTGREDNGYSPENIGVNDLFSKKEDK